MAQIKKPQALFKRCGFICSVDNFLNQNARLFVANLHTANLISLMFDGLLVTRSTTHDQFHARRVNRVRLFVEKIIIIRVCCFTGCLSMFSLFLLEISTFWFCYLTH